MLNIETLKLGVTIEGNQLRLVETELENDQRVVRNIVETQLEIPFDFYVIGNNELVTRFSDAITEVTEKAQIQATEIFYALSQRLVLMKTLTIDPDITEMELKPHLDWEIAQFVISAREEYNIGYERLPVADGQDHKVVFVSVRSKIISDLKDIFSRTRFKLCMVDVDTFASIRAINANLNGNVKTYALVELGEKGIFSYIAQNLQYLGSSEVTYPITAPGATESGAATNAELATLIAGELERILDRENARIKLRDLQEVYLYGDRLGDELVDQLNRQLTIRVQKANPFHRIKVRETPEIIDKIRLRPDRFLVSVGMAL